MGRDDELSQLKQGLKELVKAHDGSKSRIPRRFRLGDRTIWGDEALRLFENVYLYQHGIVVYQKHKTKRMKVDKFNFNKMKLHQIREAYEKISDYLLIFKQQDGRLKAREIATCRNADIRSWLLREYGIKRFFDEMNPKVIHKDGESELLKFEWSSEYMGPFAEPLVMVKVIDSSTGEVYLLQVPPDVKTCREAVAWTFRMSEGEYRPRREA